MTIDQLKTFSGISSRCVSASKALGLAVCLGMIASNDRCAAAADNAPFDPNSGVRQAGLGTPTPLDKMIALDLALGKNGVDWKAACTTYHVDIDPDDYSDKAVAIPIILGMRMSDGVLAIKAQDSEKLGAIATDIESLAEKLDVPEEKLERAKKVRSHASRGEWPKVFLELGFLQADVMKTMDEDGNKNRRAILIAAGWLQGARSISGIVLDRFSADSAELLREPLLVKTLKADLEAVKEPARQSAQVKALIKALDGIFPLLNIPMHSNPSEADVKEINRLCTECIEAILDAN